jgi:CDP-glycerol glycerophosphotransferase
MQLIHKFTKSLRYLNLKDIIAPFIFVFVLIPALLYKWYLHLSHQSLWLVCEGENDARDNGFALFSYIRKNHPDINAFYAISPKSPSYAKASRLGNIVHFSSLSHWIYYIAATKNIVIHKSANPNPPLFYILHRTGMLNGHRVFLQHGVTMNNVSYLHYNETKFELFICGALPEYEYVKANFGYTPGQVAYLGFSRFDKLFQAHDDINKQQVVIMPTWRSWLGRETNALGASTPITESRYFKTYQSLINNQHLIEYIEKHNIDIYFFQHANMEKFTNDFTAPSPRIKIVTSQTTDIQKLIRESAVMITDYSSVSIDFAFMDKPLIYYQFDEKEFRSHHLEEGYFSYKNDGFGPVVTTEKALIDQLIAYIDSGSFPEQKYLNRSGKFFTLRDDNNSMRIVTKLQDREVTRGKK